MVTTAIKFKFKDESCVPAEKYARCKTAIASATLIDFRLALHCVAIESPRARSYCDCDMAARLHPGVVSKRGKLRRVHKRPATKKSKEYNKVKYVRGHRDVPAAGVRMDRAKWKRNLAEILLATVGLPRYWKRTASFQNGTVSGAPNAGKALLHPRCIAAVQSTNATTIIANVLSARCTCIPSSLLAVALALLLCRCRRQFSS